MTTHAPLSLVLELTRTHEPQDPHAFRFEPQSYTLRTEGGGRELIEIDWGPPLLADLEAMQQRDHDPAVVQRLGNMLARFLERAGWSSRARVLAQAHEDGQRVLITIRSNAAELYALPWELLTVPGRGQHLGELPRVLLRYERPETHTVAELPSPRPEGGRILLAWSAAAGAVPAAAHEAALRKACARGHPHGEDALEVLPHASMRDLVDALTRAERSSRPFAVLHLLCHGGRSGQTHGLVLDADGGPTTVSADRWRSSLGPFAKSMRMIVLAACQGGNAGEPGNHLGSVSQALHAVGFEAVVASRHALSRDGSVTLSESLYEGLLCEHESLEQALLRARARLALDSQHLDWAALQLCARAEDGEDTRPFVFRPYRGLLAFEPTDARFFHGRETERTQLVRTLDALMESGRPRLVVVAGASGTGKSSLVRAGAVPDILATRTVPWEHAVIRPGRDPIGALEAALAGREDETRPFLLVVDQLEELFTHVRDREVRVAFARRLWRLANEDTGVCSILALRIDFLGRCGELRLDDEGTRLDAVAFDDRHRVFVAQMSAEQLRDAITVPATDVGLTLSEGLAERIVSEVGLEPGGLPLMQYTLDRLWQHRRGHELSVEAYDELGGVVGSLEQRADALLDDMPEPDLQHARRMLTELVGLGDDDTGDTRRRVPIEQLWSDLPGERERTRAVLRRFVDERLLVLDDRTRGGTTVEIAHEALIRRWARLREWLSEERDRTIGRYVVLENVRETGREQTYLGYDPELDRRVTINLLRVGRGGSSERQRLRDQARALARLSHPRAQAVYDVGVARGQVYMAMECLEGEPLRQWLTKSPRDWTEIVTAFVGIAGALEEAHRLGLVHRAFGPDVVWVDDQGAARVGGFALDRRIDLSTNVGRSAQTFAARAQARRSGPHVAVAMEAAPLEASQLGASTASVAMIDPLYMSPEQMRGQAISPTSDQFSFCVTLHEALVGELPFLGQGMAALSLSGQKRILGGRDAKIPRALREALVRGLAVDPDERWPSMAELAAALSRTTRASRRRRGGWRLWVVVGVVGLALLGGALWVS